jgi:hypothetical protein
VEVGGVACETVYDRWGNPHCACTEPATAVVYLDVGLETALVLALRGGRLYRVDHDGAVSWCRELTDAEAAALVAQRAERVRSLNGRARLLRAAEELEWHDYTSTAAALRSVAESS